MAWTTWTSARGRHVVRSLVLVLAGCGEDCSEPADDLSGPAPAADYGDAPDHRIQADGTFDDAGYPTLFAAGGAHALDVSAVALSFGPSGTAATVETNADDLDDPDGEPNFVRFREPTPDDENRDDSDDGIIGVQLNRAAGEEPVLAFELGALLLDPAKAGTYYVNVLFDHDRDGAWNADRTAFEPDGFPQSSSSTNLNEEWIVQNREVTLSEAEPLASVNFPLPLLGAAYYPERFANSDANEPYLRFVLSDQPVQGDAWQGTGTYAVGEVEDWVIEGLDDPPGIDCDGPPIPLIGAFGYDFAGAAQLPVNCTISRPEYAPVDVDLDVDVFFDDPTAGGPYVSVDCPAAGGGALTIPAGQPSAVLACTAKRLKPLDGALAFVDAFVTTDLDGGVSFVPGKGSRVRLELSEGFAALAFVDEPDDIIDIVERELTACIGLTGTTAITYGGFIYRVSADDGCSIVPNDGEAPGTFIISGGNGFRGEGDMILSVLDVTGDFVSAGDVVELKLDGVDVEGGWEVPVDVDSTQILTVQFTSGLTFQVRIDIQVNDEGFNDVTQTVVDARYEAL